MDTGIYAIPGSMDGRDIRDIRMQLGMTQREFALFAGVSKKTVEHWETGGAPVHGPVVTLARILTERKELIDYFTVPENPYPMRMLYMYRNELCTIIDVDEIRQLVRIRNFTNRIQFRAFGRNETPGYEEYTEFLKSRCFPETRDKLKVELKRLGIPFYDPLLIIEKTEGRMAEDDFHIVIERRGK